MERAEFAIESAGAIGSGHGLVVGTDRFSLVSFESVERGELLVGLILVVVILVVLAIGCGPPF